VAATYIIDEPTNCLSHSYDISHLFSRLQFLFRCNINVTHELVFLCFQRSPPQNSKVCTCGNLKEHATTLLRLLLLLLMRWPKPASPAVKGDCSDHLDAVNSIFFSQRSHDEHNMNEAIVLLLPGIVLGVELSSASRLAAFHNINK
jgi:hypothetical protein